MGKFLSLKGVGILLNEIKSYIDDTIGNAGSASGNTEGSILSQSVVSVDSWAMKNFPGDTDLESLIRYMTGMPLETSVDMEDYSELVIDRPNGVDPVYKLLVRKNGKVTSYKICDAEGNSDFNVIPMLLMGGRILEVDRFGLHPRDSFLAFRDSPSEPAVTLDFERPVEDVAEVRSLANASSVILYIKDPDCPESAMILNLRLSAKEVAIYGDVLVGNFFTDQFYDAMLGKFRCLNITFDNASINYNIIDV